MATSSLWAASTGLFMALLRFLSSRGLWLHRGRCTSAGDMTNAWHKGISAGHRVPVEICWFWRPLSTLRSTDTLLLSACRYLYRTKKSDGRAWCSCHGGLVVEFLPGVNEALVSILALVETLLACCWAEAPWYSAHGRARAIVSKLRAIVRKTIWQSSYDLPAEFSETSTCFIHSHLLVPFKCKHWNTHCLVQCLIF